MSNAGLSNTSYVVTISPSTLPATSGTPVSVTVSFNWGTVGISPLPTSMGGIASTKQVAATATMQAE
jgi:hypothetical protein